MNQDKNKIELILIKTPEYLQDQSCIGCTYFKQVKGHFGSCNAGLDPKLNPPNKYYDGTRKGSACSLYRTLIVLPENVEITTEEKYKQQRLEFNEIKRKRIIAIKRSGNPHYLKHGLNELEKTNIHGYQSPKFKNFYKGLPFQQTTDLDRKKSGYFGFRHNHHVINLALDLIKSGLKQNDIVQKIKECYNIDVSKSAITQWKYKFLKVAKPNKSDIRKNLFGLFWDLVESKTVLIDKTLISFNIKPSCPKCNDDLSVIKIGPRYNKSSIVPRFKCKTCNTKFTTRGKYAKSKLNPLIIEKFPSLFDKGLTTREIADAVFKETNVKITHNTVGRWLRKNNSRIEFHKNGSHRYDVRMRISDTLRKKSEQSKMYEMDVVAC